MQTFDLSILYSTIAVFTAGLDHPFNDWTDRHVKQGFSWREESVSFSTLRDYGVAKVQVVMAGAVEIAPDVSRAILVPFTVVESGKVEVTSIDRGKEVTLPSGNYALIYQAKVLNENEELCLLTFVPSREKIEPEILRADPQLLPEYPLLMSARAA
jgi:hypothetical protein